MNTKRKQIISEIAELKKNPNLKLKLKEKTDYFTNLLFYTLFDSDTALEENIDILEQTFEELVSLACWKTHKPCSKIWDSYLEKLPEILQKLNKDADSFMKSDPAANSIEEV